MSACIPSPSSLLRPAVHSQGCSWLSDCEMQVGPPKACPCPPVSVGHQESKQCSENQARADHTRQCPDANSNNKPLTLLQCPVESCGPGMPQPVSQWLAGTESGSETPSAADTAPRLSSIPHPRYTGLGGPQDLAVSQHHGIGADTTKSLSLLQAPEGACRADHCFPGRAPVPPEQCVSYRIGTKLSVKILLEMPPVRALSLCGIFLTFLELHCLVLKT